MALDVEMPGGWTVVMTTPQEDLLPATRRALLHRIAVAQVEGRAPSLVAAVVRGGRTVWHGSRTSVDGHRARRERAVPDRFHHQDLHRGSGDARCGTRGSWTSETRWRSICRTLWPGRRPSPNCFPTQAVWRPSRLRRGGSAHLDPCVRSSRTCWVSGRSCMRPAGGSTTRTPATRCWARWSRSCGEPRGGGPARRGARAAGPASHERASSSAPREAGRCIPGPMSCFRNRPRTSGGWPRLGNCGPRPVTWPDSRPFWSRAMTGC